MKIKILFFIILSLFVGGTAGTATYFGIKDQNLVSQSIEKKEKYIDRTNNILEDIKKLNINLEVKNDFTLLIKKHYKKILKIFALFESNEKNVYETEERIASSKLYYDYDSNEIKTKIDDQISFWYKDPMPNRYSSGSFDDIRFTFNYFNCEFKVIPNFLKNDWFGEIYQYNFKNCSKIDNSIYVDLTLEKWFLLWSVKYITTHKFAYEGIDNTKFLYKFNRNKLISSLFERVNIPNDVVYNKYTIKRYKPIRFSENFSTLWELNHIYEIWKLLQEEKDNPLYQSLKKDIEEYRFFSYNDIAKRYDYLKKYNVLIPANNDDDFKTRINKLNIFLTNNEIKIDNIPLDFSFYQQIYQFLLLYLYKNDIKLKTTINHYDYEIKLWKDMQFVDIFTQIPEEFQSHTNTLIFENNYLLNEIKNTYESTFIIFDKMKVENKQTFSIRYRWDYKYDTVDVVYNKNNDGILLNTNRLLSEIINNFGIYDSEWLLKKINDTLFNKTLFNKINLINQDNWFLYSSYLNLNDFNTFFGLNTNNTDFNYQYSDKQGIFYVFLEVSDLYYDDGSLGNYDQEMIQNISNQLNKKHHVFYQVQDNSKNGHFILKIMTNKIAI